MAFRQQSAQFPEQTRRRRAACDETANGRDLQPKRGSCRHEVRVPSTPTAAGGLRPTRQVDRRKCGRSRCPGWASSLAAPGRLCESGSTSESSRSGLLSPRGHVKLLEAEVLASRKTVPPLLPLLVDADAYRSCPAKRPEPERRSVAALAWRSIGRRAAFARVFAELDALARGELADTAHCPPLAPARLSGPYPCSARCTAAWRELVVAASGFARLRTAIG